MHPPQPPFPANEPPFPPRPRKGPAIIFTVIITMVVVSLFWIIAIAGVVYHFTRNTPSFSTKVDAPSHAEVGETISLRVKVSNPNDKVLTLDSIDIHDSLLDGFRVIGVSPAVSTAHGFGSSSYYFSRTLSSGETMDVIFELEALKPGVWTGDIDFCVPSQAFITSATTIRIDPAGTSPKVAEEEDEDDIPPFVLDIKTPHLVTLGGNFTMRVNVTNPTDSPLVLQTINLMGRLPEGIQIQSVSPEPEENQSDAESWYLHLEKSLAPGETFRTEWVMKPVKTGIWTGDLGFWSEKRESFATSSMTIRVNPSTPEETTVPD